MMLKLNLKKEVVKLKFIDVLKDDYLKFPKFRSNFFKSDLEENLCNILEYIIYEYDLKVTHIANLMGVKRQTIYNYFKLNTHELPTHVIEKINQIYGYYDFKEVLNIELILKFSGIFKYEIQDQLDQGKPFSKIKHKYNYLFEHHKRSPKSYIRLKKEFDFRTKWKKAYAGLKLQDNINMHTYVEFKEFANKNSVPYVEKLISLLNKANFDDKEIMEFLKKYTKKKEKEKLTKE